MRKSAITKVFAAVLTLMLAFTSVLSVPISAEAAAKPTKITLAAKKKTMSVGEKYTLKVKSVTPKGASKSVKFKSSNGKVATVNSKGQITAKKKGTATITVTSKSNSKAKATCKITVQEAIKKITVTNSVSNTVAVRIGKTLTLKTKLEPSGVKNKKLTYSSNKKSVATVDSKGKVKAKKAGTAKITIKAAAGKAKTTITVKVPAKNKVVKSVKASPDKKTVTVGEKFKITPTVSPKNATVKLVSYKSSNQKVATVDGKGNVTAKGAGTATITVATLDGNKKATCKVTVNPVLVSGITLNKASATLNVGGTEQLTATVAPANAGNKNVTWKSSNTSVATISGSGNTITVTGKAAGKAVITATAADGSGKSAACAITVNAPSTPTPQPPTPQEVAITGVTMQLNGNSTIYANTAEKLSVTATVAPANTTMSKQVTYTSSSEYVTVEANGALKVNTDKLASEKADSVKATITAKTVNGKTATADVTIILRENADVSDNGFYAYDLKGDAEFYQVDRNDGSQAVDVEKTDIAETMKNFAEYQWSNTTVKDNWDDESFVNLMKKVAFPGAKDVTGAVNEENVMVISRTGSNKTVEVTLENEEGTDLTFVYKDGSENAGKVVHMRGINITSEEETYSMTATVQVENGADNRNLLVEIAKDGAYIKAYRVSGNSNIQIAAIEAVENGYSIEANRTYVVELGLSESIEKVAVKNVYVPLATTK